MPWTFHAASEFGIPRLVFHGTSFFSLSASDIVDNLNPHDKHEESFTLHGFPHEIQLFKSQIPDLKKSNPALLATIKEVKELDKKSYGVLVNSFYELEPECADYYREVIGRRAWHVGPVSLCVSDQARMNHDHYCLKWLNKKKLNSVLYVCFGSLCRLSGTQLKEIALALESANQEFIWVVRKMEEDEEEWLPEGYEKRMEDKGLIIRGWVPQVLILNHEALGGFLTHCGWNSTLEGVAAGVPLMTWPLGADQFLNEKLVVEVLGVGVRVGAKAVVSMEGGEKGTSGDQVVRREMVVKAVERLMDDGDEEGKKRRERVKELEEKAKRALMIGGSSWLNLDLLIGYVSEHDVVKLHG